MWSDLCTDLVPIPITAEKQMLYHMSYLQLGSFNDVQSGDFCTKLLYLEFGTPGTGCLVGMGDLCIPFSRTILGIFQWGIAVRKLYGQTLYTVLSEVKKEEMNKIRATVRFTRTISAAVALLFIW